MRRPIVSVIGSNAAPEGVIAAAEELGRCLVDGGARIATGGLGGVMDAASRGAHRSPAYREGDVLGLLPSADPADANPWVDIAVPTSMGLARNVLVVAVASAVVAVAGGSGTLSELAFAWQMGKPIVLLDVGTGWSSEWGERPFDARPRALPQSTRSPSEAARLALEAAGSQAAEIQPRRGGPGPP